MQSIIFLFGGRSFFKFLYSSSLLKSIIALQKCLLATSGSHVELSGRPLLGIIKTIARSFNGRNGIFFVTHQPFDVLRALQTFASWFESAAARPSFIERGNVSGSAQPPPVSIMLRSSSFVALTLFAGGLCKPVGLSGLHVLLDTRYLQLEAASSCIRSLFIQFQIVYILLLYCSYTRIKMGSLIETVDFSVFAHAVVALTCSRSGWYMHHGNYRISVIFGLGSGWNSRPKVASRGLSRLCRSRISRSVQRDMCRDGFSCAEDFVCW